MKLDVKVPLENIGSIQFSGGFTISQDILGDIDLVIETSRCSLDLTICEKVNPVNIKGLCDKFKDLAFSNMFSSIRPKLECPIKAGNYTLNKATFDLKLVSIFPLAGNVWVVSFKFVVPEKEKKTKKIVFCMMSETKITRANRKI